MFCHGDTTLSPQAPQVATFDGASFVYDFEAGNLPGLVPYYADADGNVQSFWEMGLSRVLDGSMPPATQVPVDDPAFLQFRAWVEAGFTEACP
jgi:hypothetical protein